MHRITCVKELKEVKTVPASGIIYVRDKKTCKLGLNVIISGVHFSQDMIKVLNSSDNIRTMTFPAMVRSIEYGTFYDIKSLRSIVLNEGLETLGTDR